MTAGNGSMSTTTISAASFAWATVSAIDRGDRLADMPDLVRRQRVVDRGQHRRAVAIVHHLARRQRADAALRQIGRGVDREHAGHRARRRGVDAADDAVRDMAAHHHRISLAGQADIVGVMPLAAQQHRVFASAAPAGRSQTSPRAPARPDRCSRPWVTFLVVRHRRADRAAALDGKLDLGYS